VGDSFAASATKLAGLAGALLGWRPEEFWSATPAELAVIIAALSPSGDAADADLISRLKEQFPDG
jgi:Phage tail assembly chaperone protein, TAC